MNIRNLEIGDYHKGYLELLQHLTLTGDIHISRFQQIFDRVKYNPFHHIFVLLDSAGQQVIGSITAIIEWKFIHGGSQVAHLEDVVVSPNHQGQGLGKKLVNHVIQWVCDNYPHCYKIILDCKSENAKFYEKCGFRKNGVEMRYSF